MRPSQEYLDSIMNKLDALKKADGTDTKSNNRTEGYGLPSLVDQVGMTAMKYLEDQKKLRDDQ